MPKIRDGSGGMIRKPKDSEFSLGEVPQAELGWPTIPAIPYSGLATVSTLLNFGP